jgi:hypothetical protein
MEPSNERKEATQKDTGADLDLNMLIESSFAIEEQLQSEGLLELDPINLDELDFERILEPTFRIVKDNFAFDYAASLVRKLSADEIGKLLAQEANDPIVQMMIISAAVCMEAQDSAPILIESIKNSPPEVGVIALMMFSQTFVDSDVANAASIFLQRDGLPIDVLKNAFEILESLSKEALATTAGVLKTLCKHESPEIRATAQPIFRKAMSGLVHEFLTAGHNTKPGEEMSPREQMIVNMKKELGAKLLKPRNTES